VFSKIKNKYYLASGNGVFLSKTAFADDACNKIKSNNAFDDILCR